MNINQIVEHNKPLVAELKRSNPYWKCTRARIVTVVDPVQIITNKHGHKNMIGWILQRRAMDTNVILIVPYSNSFGLTAEYRVDEYKPIDMKHYSISEWAKYLGITYEEAYEEGVEYILEDGTVVYQNS